MRKEFISDTPSERDMAKHPTDIPPSDITKTIEGLRGAILATENRIKDSAAPGWEFTDLYRTLTTHLDNLKERLVAAEERAVIHQEKAA